MKARLRSLSKPVHALPSCTNSIKHAFPPLLQLDPSPHTQRLIHTQTDRHTHTQTRTHTDTHTQTDTHADRHAHRQTGLPSKLRLSGGGGGGAGSSEPSLGSGGRLSSSEGGGGEGGEGRGKLFSSTTKDIEEM